MKIRSSLLLLGSALTPLFGQAPPIPIPKIGEQEEEEVAKEEDTRF